MLVPTFLLQQQLWVLVLCIPISQGQVTGRNCLSLHCEIQTAEISNWDEIADCCFTGKKPVQSHIQVWITAKHAELHPPKLTSQRLKIQPILQAAQTWANWKVSTVWQRNELLIYWNALQNNCIWNPSAVLGLCLHAGVRFQEMGHKREWKTKEIFEVGVKEHTIKWSKTPSSHLIQMKPHSSHGQAIKKQISPVCFHRGEKHLQTWWQFLLLQTTCSQQAACLGMGHREGRATTPSALLLVRGADHPPWRGPAPCISLVSGLNSSHWGTPRWVPAVLHPARE